MASYAVQQNRGSGFKLSRNARRVRTVVVLAVLIALGSQILTWQTGSDLVAGESAVANTEAVEVDLHYVSVRAGDTLWALANRYAPNQDPQVWIDKVVEINNLSTANIQVGQLLVIPGK